MTKVTLTVACPEANRDDATHLAVALGWIEGWSPDEWKHAFTAEYQDAAGNLYRIMSCPVGEGFVLRASAIGPIERPPQDVGPYVVDLNGAHRAQAMLVTWTPSAGVPVPQVDAAKIVAVVGLPGTEALSAMGLTPPPQPED